jgi:hypothetical protein
VAVVFENLVDGLGLQEILDSYPTLQRGDAVQVLKAAGESVTTAAA